MIEPDHGGVIPFKHRVIFDEIGIEYEYWDLRYLKGGKGHLEPIRIAHSDVLIKSIPKNNLEAEIQQLKNVVFITGHGISRKNRFFYQLLKRHNIHYIVLMNVHYFFNTKQRIWNLLLATKKGYLAVFLIYFYQPLLKLFNRLALDINPPVLTILGNSHDYAKYNFPFPKDKIIYYYNINYDRIRSYLGSAKDENTIVFIDQNLPWHNETAGYKWKMNPKTYYSKIAKFLLKTQELTGKTAVIATHPKTEVGKIEPFVGDIPIIYGKTFDLISKCSISVAHMSTAIDFCILMKKPVVFVSCSEIEKSPAAWATKLYARELGKKVVVIDEIRQDYLLSKEIEENIIVDERKYTKFIRNNIMPDNSPQMPYWEYVARFVKNME